MFKVSIIVPIAVSFLFVCAPSPVIANEDIVTPEGYRLIWNDEFTSSQIDDKKWGFEEGYIRNQELQWYSKNNAKITKGNLVLTGSREKNKKNPNFDPAAKGGGNWKKKRQFIAYTSASLNTRGKFKFQYGILEVRAKIITEKGLWPAIWTLGENGTWPSNGEVDLLEYYGGSILANACWATPRQWQAKWDSSKTPITKFTKKDPEFFENYHVWKMDWNEKRILLYMDDILLNTVDLSKTINPRNVGPKNPFHQPHYILLNLAIGGKAAGTPAKTTKFPSEYKVDYVRVFQKIK